MRQIREKWLKILWKIGAVAAVPRIGSGKRGRGAGGQTIDFGNHKRNEKLFIEMVRMS